MWYFQSFPLNIRCVLTTITQPELIQDICPISAVLSSEQLDGGGLLPAASHQPSDPLLLPVPPPSVSLSGVRLHGWISVQTVVAESLVSKILLMRSGAFQLNHGPVNKTPHIITTSLS